MVRGGSREGFSEDDSPLFVTDKFFFSIKIDNGQTGTRWMVGETVSVGASVDLVKRTQNVATNNALEVTQS